MEGRNRTRGGGGDLDGGLVGLDLDQSLSFGNRIAFGDQDRDHVDAVDAFSQFGNPYFDAHG
jgi:hypothetical protein